MSVSECVIWAGARTNGYGVVNVGGRIKRVHRLVWEEANGPIPDGLVIMHTCDTPACVRLEHLRLGTKADNTADMISKGRQQFHPENLSPGYHGPLGESHHKAKLTEADVRAIRASGRTQRDLAAEYGVTQATIWHIIHRDTWKRVMP